MELEYSTMSSEATSMSSEMSHEITRLEECRIEGVRLQLPQGLCENKDIFKEFFSHRMWQDSFTEQQKQHLKNFLPSFPENDNLEKDDTIRRLFARENMRFNVPLNDFHTQLKNGHFRPDIARMRALIRKAHLRDYRIQQRQYFKHIMKQILVSRQRLLESAFSQAPGAPLRVELPPATTPNSAPTSCLSNFTYANGGIDQRTKRRYFRELAAVREEVGQSEHSSEDDNYPEGPPPRLSKKQKRQLAALQSSLSPDSRQVSSTMSLRPTVGPDLEANIVPGHNPYEPNEDAYRAMLARHKRRRIRDDSHPDLNIQGLTLHDVATRAQMGKRPPILRPVLTSPTSQVSTTITPQFQEVNKVSKKGITGVRIKFEPQTNSKLPHVRLSSPQLSGENSNHGSDIGGGDSGDDAESDQISMSEDVSCITTERQMLEVKTEPCDNKPSNSAPRSRIRRCGTSGTSPKTNVKIQQHNRSLLHQTQNRIKTEPQESCWTGHDNSVQSHQPASQQQNATPRILHSTPIRKTFPPATLSDLDGIDMMNLPVDLDDSASASDIKPAPELMQETHACFFSLIRDVICSTTQHRMGMVNLQDRLKAWQENPISPLNDWYCLAPDTWVQLLPSALGFLCGDYPDCQPDEFVPYLEYKGALQVYQWIGAGRDSDGHLLPLCQHWLARRDEMNRSNKPGSNIPTSCSSTSRRHSEISAIVNTDIEGGEGMEEDERAQSPPPPRCPTNWVVRPTTPAEKEAFQEQEHLRYENPHKAFTFRMHGYESVVGPVKGVYNQSAGANKPRGHSLLVDERPNFVTILALVRDATARLPNGEGTRSEICELLKDSQYLAPITQESYLHSVVSGALDRLHYETDPCVKYDTKRKIWMYLHRARSEQEFERLHHQQQGVAKTKKSAGTRKPGNRKSKQDISEQPTNATSSVPSVTITSSQNQNSVSSTPIQKQTSTVMAQTIARTPRSNVQHHQPLTTQQQQQSRNSTVHNVQVSTPSGLQTIQVTASTTPITGSIAGGKSILTNNSNSPQVVRGVQISGSGAVSGQSSGTVMKTVTLTPQQMQVMANARVAAAQGGGTTAIRMPISTASLISSIGASIVSAACTAAPTTGSSGEVRISTAGSQPTSAILRQSSTGSPQLVNLSQLLGGSRSPQQGSANSSTMPVTPTTTPTILSAQTASGKNVGLTGVKLVNAVKAALQQQSGEQAQQQQTIFIKPQNQHGKQQQQEQQQVVVGGQQQQLLQHQVKAIAQFQQLQLQQQQLKQQQQTSAASGTQHQRVVTSVSMLGGQQAARVVTRVGGKPIPVTLSTQSQAQQQPMVAKVFTNAQGQVISMESLLAHHKQHGALPQGTALRVTTAGAGTGQAIVKTNQPGQSGQPASLIQIPSGAGSGVTQFAVVSQGSLLSVGGQGVSGSTRILQASQIQQAGQQAGTVPQQQTVVAATSGGPKIVTASQAGVGTTALRVVGAGNSATGGATGGLNLTHIGGKPVLIAASKGQSAGQNVILTTSQAGGTGNQPQTVVLASRSQGGALVLQPGGAQQILLPPGALNIKTLQGLKVIPLAQATGNTTAGKGRQQVYARILNPGLRPTNAAISTSSNIITTSSPSDASGSSAGSSEQ